MRSKTQKTAAIVLLSVCVSVPLAAQSPLSGTASAGDDGVAERRRILLEVERWHRQRVDPEQSAATKRQREFAACVEEFTKAWNALMAKNAKGVWSPRQAKAVHKAFARLLQSEGWLEDAR